VENQVEKFFLKGWMIYPKAYLVDAAKNRGIDSNGTKEQIATRLVLDDNKKFDRAFRIIAGIKQEDEKNE